MSLEEQEVLPVSKTSFFQRYFCSTATLNWLLGLAVLYTLYFAKSLLVPVVVALMFALLLSPLVNLLKRLYVPRAVSGILLLCLIGIPFTLLGMQLAEPAQKWAKRLPDLSAHITERITDIADVIQVDEVELIVSPEREVREPPERQGFFSRLFGREKPPEKAPASVVKQQKKSASPTVNERMTQGSVELMLSILSATPAVIAQFLTGIILILFLLIFGPNLFVVFVDVFPQVRDKQRTVQLVGTIQHELSRYIITVSAINAGLGVITGCALWLLGVEDALLWGALVALANYAPYVGPIAAMGVLIAAGLAQYGGEWIALMPVGVYFCINLIEAQFVTPLTLGRHMRLNPLVLIFWLLLWGWLWGAVGVLIAVPLLVCLKLVAAKLQLIPSVLKLIETRA